MRALAESKLWQAGWLWGFADVLEGGHAVQGKAALCVCGRNSALPLLALT